MRTLQYVIISQLFPQLFLILEKRCFMIKNFILLDRYAIFFTRIFF